jgi:hypothetical protein
MLPYLNFDVLLTTHAATSVAYCLHRTLLVTERTEKLWRLVPRCHAHITGSDTLLPLLQKLHAQPIWWLESWMERREFFIADLAVEQEHVAKDLMHGMHSPQRALLQDDVVFRGARSDQRLGHKDNLFGNVLLLEFFWEFAELHTMFRGVPETVSNIFEDEGFMLHEIVTVLLLRQHLPPWLLLCGLPTAQTKLDVVTIARHNARPTLTHVFVTLTR